MKAIAWLHFPFGLKKVVLDVPEPTKPTLEELNMMIPQDCRPQRISIEMVIEIN